MYVPVMGAGAVEELHQEGGRLVSSELCWGVHGWLCVGVGALDCVL